MNGKRIAGLLLDIYKYILIIMTVLMFIIVGTNVFSRYILNSSLGWADELARFLFIWISFLGAVLAYQANEHIGLNYVVEKLPSGRIKELVLLSADLLVLIVIFFLVKYGWIVANSATNVSPALYIPMKTVYMIVPVSSVLMLLINVNKIISRLRALVVKNSLPADERGVE